MYGFFVCERYHARGCDHAIVNAIEFELLEHIYSQSDHVKIETIAHVVDYDSAVEFAKIQDNYCGRLVFIPLNGNIRHIEREVDNV